MLDRFFMVVAFGAAMVPASPAPSPTPTATPAPLLKTIAHVRAKASCARIVTHANSAIVSALRNDAELDRTVSLLRTVDLDDGNPIHRFRDLNAIAGYASSLVENAISGKSEVERLRALAAKSTDPVQKKELKAFADALGGALWRQQKIARDLNGYVAYVNFHDIAKLDRSERLENEALFGVPDSRTIVAPMDVVITTGPGETNQDLNSYYRPIAPISHDPSETATQQARAAAADLVRRLPAISGDESRAADDVTGAFSGC